MMKKYLNKQWIFNIMLCLLSCLTKVKFIAPMASFLAGVFARIHLALSKTNQLNTPKELAEKWKEFMPVDNQSSYRIKEFDDTTAITEIHIRCPLRGSGDVNACFKLMNYDRTLMDRVGGQLIVLDSQSDSGKRFCRLAIRKKGVNTDDLIPACS